MLLLIGSKDDRLLGAVERHARQRRIEARIIESDPGAFRDAIGAAAGGITGILLRLGPESDLAVQAGTIAEALPCPVVNRPHRGFHHHSAERRVELASSLIRHAGPVPPGACRPGARIYLAGGEVFGAQIEAPLVAWVHSCRATLAGWQRETGILFCRLSCGEGPSHELHVDTHPDLSRESEELTSAIAAAVLRLLRSHREDPHRNF